MMLTPNHYVPVLRWRAGEYRALEKLDDVQKELVVPLLEILEPDFNFETNQPSKDIDTHLGAFADQFLKHWDWHPALLEGSQLKSATRMRDGSHPMAYLFGAARTQHARLIPVTGFARDADYQAAVAAIVATDGRGLALRIALDDALDHDLDKSVAALLSPMGLGADALDLLLDLGSPSFEPQDTLIDIIVAALGGSATIREARSVTLIATSFPETLSSLDGPIHVVQRSEWLLYKALIAKLGTARRPGFGDYAISAIEFPKGDMRFMRGAPNVRYTIEDAWVIVKGKREKGGTKKTYVQLCERLFTVDKLTAAGFSEGSAYIHGCREGNENGGNTTTWKWVGTNHHITRVVHDLARLAGL
jgi:hypothetical protein